MAVCDLKRLLLRWVEKRDKIQNPKSKIVDVVPSGTVAPRAQRLWLERFMNSRRQFKVSNSAPETPWRALDYFPWHCGSLLYPRARDLRAYDTLLIPSGYRLDMRRPAIGRSCEDQSLIPDTYLT